MLAAVDHGTDDSYLGTLLLQATIVSPIQENGDPYGLVRQASGRISNQSVCRISRFHLHDFPDRPPRPEEAASQFLEEAADQILGFSLSHGTFSS